MNYDDEVQKIVWDIQSNRLYHGTMDTKASIKFLKAVRELLDEDIGLLEVVQKRRMEPVNISPQHTSEST
jgi:hypothetical protein